MHTVHEGEILLREKYGAYARERIYVKPPLQANVVVVEQTKPLDVHSWLTRLFLPQGYPESVSKDYLSYQIWDTAQAFCSTITGILATQQVLRGVGVGDSSASPLAATITWVLKDGCGHIGRIVFAFSYGTCLDAYSKKWRLYADVLNDAALCIEVGLPMLRSYTIIGLCISTAMKAIVGVAGSATRIALTQHHAVRGNMADVAAKDSAQETAVNLVASVIALLILGIIGTPLWLFFTLTSLHIAFNYLAVRSVCLKTLNEPRFLQVINYYIRHEILASPCEVNHHEPIVLFHHFNYTLDYALCGFQIKVGSSIKKITQRYPQSALLKKIAEAYGDRTYLLYPVFSKRLMYVMVRDNYTTDDLLCAYFHAVILSAIVCAINDVDTVLYSSTEHATHPFAQVVRTLQSVDWSRDPAEDVLRHEASSFDPSLELLKYVSCIAHREWKRFREALRRNGWDTSKQLIMMDEWRVYEYKKINEEHESIGHEERENVEKAALFDRQTFLKGTISDLASLVNDEEDLVHDEDENDEVEHIFTIEPEEKDNDRKQSETLRVPSNTEPDSLKQKIENDGKVTRSALKVTKLEDTIDVPPSGVLTTTNSDESPKLNKNIVPYISSHHFRINPREISTSDISSSKGQDLRLDTKPEKETENEVLTSNVKDYTAARSSHRISHIEKSPDLKHAISETTQKTKHALNENILEEKHHLNINSPEHEKTIEQDSSKSSPVKNANVQHKRVPDTNLISDDSSSLNSDKNTVSKKTKDNQPVKEKKLN